MSGREIWRFAGATLVAMLALAASRVALAQQSVVLERVTVWAQKRESLLQDAPIAMSMLTADDLAVAGIEDVDDVARHAPLFDLQRSVGPTTTSFRVRRVGSLGNIPTFEPAIGLLVDGAFRPRSFLGTNDLLDVERIEVLAGPQATLYGKSVSGGVIAIYTRRPSKALEIRGELTSGFFDSAKSPGITRLKFGLSGPLSESLGASIAAAYSQHGHTAVNAIAGMPDGNDQDRVTLRGQFEWSPGPQFDIRLIAGYVQEKDDQGESDVYFAPGAGSTAVAGLFERLASVPLCPDNTPRNRESCAAATNTLDVNAVDLTLIGDYRLSSERTLTSITAWDSYESSRSDNDSAQLSAPMLFFHDLERGETLQEELRLTGASKNAKWLTGAMYYRSRYRRGEPDRAMFGPNGDLAFHPVWPALLQGLPLAAPDQFGIHDSGVDTEYFGIFAQAQWLLTKQFSVTTGLRWHEEKKQATISNSVTAPGASLLSVVLTPTLSPGGENVNGTADRAANDMAWSVTPQYRFSNQVMSYFTVSQNSRFGGFNTIFGNTPLSSREFDDESVMHYELGARATAGRMRFSAAAFHTQYENYQDAAFISAQFSVGNARHVDLTGVEVQGNVLLSDRVTADFAVSYADLRYDSNTTGACYPGRAPDGSRPRSCDLRGEHPINAPEWSTHVGLDYVRPVEWGELFARLDWSWTDQYNTSFSADPRLIQEAYSDIALRIGARIGKSYELICWGDNLLDEQITYIDALLNLFDDASYQSYVAAPRSYGVTVRMRF